MEIVITVVKVVITLACLMVAFSPNVLYAAFSLLVAFGGVAVVYAMAGADLLAGAQVIVYIGGILVVILFAVMLSQRIYKNPLSAQIKRGLGAALVGGALTQFLWQLHDRVNWDDYIKKDIPEITSSVRMIGNALLKEYLLPFEAVSILLLAALVGGMVISRPSERDEAEGEARS